MMQELTPRRRRTNKIINAVNKGQFIAGVSDVRERTRCKEDRAKAIIMNWPRTTPTAMLQIQINDLIYHMWKLPPLGPGAVPTLVSLKGTSFI
jgi:hypothetical protein